jgi:hypothetical protein
MKKKNLHDQMPISRTFNRIFPDLQDFQAWKCNQQVQISKTSQIFIFKAPYEPCETNQITNACAH